MQPQINKPENERGGENEHEQGADEASKQGRKVCLAFVAQLDGDAEKVDAARCLLALQ